MNSAEIIEALRQKISVTSGRHLYGVLGTYAQLDTFADHLHQVKTFDGIQFPKPVNVNRGILEAIPDEEFKDLAENEAKYPEPTAAHVNRAFKSFLTETLNKTNIAVLRDLEMLFAYNMEMNLLRTMATDEKKVLLLLPGKRAGDRIAMFHEMGESGFHLPTNLIADNHLWELRE